MQSRDESVPDPRAAGPGSQPADEAELSVLPLPRGMQTFEMPRVPERVDPLALAAARELLARFLDTPAGLDPAGTAPAVLDIVNQVLGEGEVSIRARTAVPEVARASDDDLADSRTRLAELVRWMGKA